MYTPLSYFPPLLTGIPFEIYVNDFILKPLGMNSTTYFSKTAVESGHLADGMGRDGVNQTEDVFGLGRVRAYPFWAPNEGNPGNGNYDPPSIGGAQLTDSYLIKCFLVLAV